MSDKAIVITDKVYFASGRNRILRQSYDLIEEIAGVMLHNPQIEIIEIGGHTDDKGSARGNQRLSEKRAKAVYKRLISLGVPKDRLTFKGYGEDNPIADNGNAEGRATNRRVEFIIVKQRKE